MVLSTKLQYLKDVISGKVCDDAAVGTSQANLVNAHDDWRLIANGAFQLFNQVMSYVLDRVYR